MHLGLDEAAARADVKPDRLLEWEQGISHPSIPQARRLADVYKRPLAALYLPAPPRDFTVPHDFRRLPDMPTPAPSPRLIEEIRLAEYRRSLALDLADEDEGQCDLIGLGSVGDDAEELAGGVRELLAVTPTSQHRWKDDYEAFNGWKTSMESRGVLVFQFSRIDVDEARAFSIAADRFPVVAINGSDGPRARIFSLLHELGHLVLRRGGISDLHENEPMSPDSAVEIFCNRFAGAVLVPRESLLQQELVRRASPRTAWTNADLDLLARLYRVSREVVLRRLLINGRTSDSFYRQWQSEHRAPPASEDAKSGFMSVPRRAVRAVGQPFARIVLGAFYDDTITLGDVSEYLGVRVKHVPAIEALVTGAGMVASGDR